MEGPSAVTPANVQVPKRAEAFQTTQWSLVKSAGRADDKDSQKALEKVCLACWYPIYAFVRRQGYEPEDAQDLTQGFFHHVIKHNTLAHADQERGRFRSFLLGALRHFVSNETRMQQAKKRGGGVIFLSMDADEDEQRLERELADPRTPEKLFERNWAENLINRANEALRMDYERCHKLKFFEALKPYLTGSANPDSQKELAESLGVSTGSLAVMVFRMRKRYGERLRQEIALTVTDPADLQSEIRLLIEAMAD